MAIEGHQKNIRDLIMGDNMSFHIPIYNNDGVELPVRVSQSTAENFSLFLECQTTVSARRHFGLSGLLDRIN